MNIHLREKLYKCETCGKLFEFKNHFENHIRIHSDERAFKCELCASDFKTKQGLRSHMFD